MVKSSPNLGVYVGRVEVNRPSTTKRIPKRWYQKGNSPYHGLIKITRAQNKEGIARDHQAIYKGKIMRIIANLLSRNSKPRGYAVLHLKA